VSHHSSPGPRRDPTLYERLISRGIAEADARGSCIDHVTARRLAIWMVPRAQDDTELMRGLIRFARTGAISHVLRDRLRHHARTPLSPNGPHAFRLLQYAVARGADHGVIGPDFGAACDQIDRADAMLEDLHQRVSDSRCAPKQAARRGGEPTGPFAMARYDPDSQTVALLLDAVTAKAAVQAITASALDREASARRARHAGQALPDGSYGRDNRAFITARETRLAAGLRAVERAYRAALDPDPAAALELTQIDAAARAPDRELEME
jgi:hypothetical protein